MTKNPTCMLMLIALTGLTLTGCSSYQNHFDCPPGQGVGCKSVSQVDHLVEQGKFGQTEEDEDGEKIVRKPLRVWLAPYTDQYGNLHSSSVAFVNREDD